MRQIASARTLLGAVLLSASARADQLEYTTYGFSDNRDNSVYTTAFNLTKTLWTKTVMLLDVEVDAITVPPLQTDAVSGASRPQRRGAQNFEKSRGQAILGFETGLGENALFSASYYQSREVDYYSQALMGSWTQDLFQKNTTLHFQGQYTWDDVGEILGSGELATSFKQVHQGAFSLTQLLSTTQVLRLGADVMRLNGLLSDPYRRVILNDLGGNPMDTVKENHPSLRWRQAGWVEISQYLAPVEASLIGHYRYYFDDWNVRSHTAQFKLNKYVTSNLIASPEYRYYVQTGADFGDYAKQDPGAYFTLDYKLEAFESNNIGLGLTYFLRGVASRRASLDFLAGASLSVSYFRYWNSQKFNSNMLQSKVNFGF